MKDDPVRFIWCWENIVKDEQEEVEVMFRIMHPEAFMVTEQQEDIMAQVADKMNADFSDETPEPAIAERIKKFNRLDEVE